MLYFLYFRYKGKKKKQALSVVYKCDNDFPSWGKGGVGHRGVSHTKVWEHGRWMGVIACWKSSTSLSSKNLHIKKQHSGRCAGERRVASTAPETKVPLLEELLFAIGKHSQACKLEAVLTSTLCSPQGGHFLVRNHWFYIRQIHIITTSSKLPMIPCIMFPRESSVRGTNDFNFSGMKLPLNYLLYNLSTYCVNNGKKQKEHSSST